MLRQADINRQLNQWLIELALQGQLRTHGEIVYERVQWDEQSALSDWPRQRIDTAYHDHRRVAWDGRVEVQGNRCSVPDALCGQTVRIHVTLSNELMVYRGPGADRAK